MSAFVPTWQLSSHNEPKSAVQVLKAVQVYHLAINLEAATQKKTLKLALCELFAAPEAAFVPTTVHLASRES